MPSAQDVLRSFQQRRFGSDDGYYEHARYRDPLLQQLGELLEENFNEFASIQEQLINVWASWTRTKEPASLEAATASVLQRAAELEATLAREKQVEVFVTRLVSYLACDAAIHQSPTLFFGNFVALYNSYPAQRILLFIFLQETQLLPGIDKLKFLAQFFSEIPTLDLNEFYMEVFVKILFSSVKTGKLPVAQAFDYGESIMIPYMQQEPFAYKPSIYDFLKLCALYTEQMPLKWSDIFLDIYNNLVKLKRPDLIIPFLKLLPSEFFPKDQAKQIILSVISREHSFSHENPASLLNQLFDAIERYDVILKDDEKKLLARSILSRPTLEQCPITLFSALQIVKLLSPLTPEIISQQQNLLELCSHIIFNAYCEMLTANPDADTNDLESLLSAVMSIHEAVFEKELQKISNAYSVIQVPLANLMREKNYPAAKELKSQSDQCFETWASYLELQQQLQLNPQNIVQCGLALQGKNLNISVWAGRYERALELKARSDGMTIDIPQAPTASMAMLIACFRSRMMVTPVQQITQLKSEDTSPQKRQKL